MNYRRDSIFTDQSVDLIDVLKFMQVKNWFFKLLEVDIVSS